MEAKVFICFVGVFGWVS